VNATRNEFAILRIIFHWWSTKYLVLCVGYDAITYLQIFVHFKSSLNDSLNFCQTTLNYFRVGVTLSSLQ